jgi:hypothetical protein
VSRPAALDYVEVSTGALLDTVTLVDDRLSYATGTAEQMFLTYQNRFGWSAAMAYDELAGWSNGYVALRPR